MLVAHAPRLDAPLRLRFGDGAATAAVLTERVLVRVEVGGDGVQTYRITLSADAVGGRSSRHRIPRSGAESEPARVARQRCGHAGDGGRKRQARRRQPYRPAETRLAALVRKPTVLDVSYQLQALRTGSGTLHTCAPAASAARRRGPADDALAGDARRRAEPAGPGTGRRSRRRAELDAARLAVRSDARHRRRGSRPLVLRRPGPAAGEDNEVHRK